MGAPTVPIVGTEVTQLRFDFAVGISFDAAFHLRIETRFALTGADGGAGPLDPDGDPSRLGALLTLTRTTVTAAELDEAGVLRIAFSDGRAITCAPDPRFEAWTFTGPGGLLLVCCPGGGLAIWDARID